MISFGNQRKWRGKREKEEKGELARTRVCVLPWNRSQLSVPVGAFHKDKRRIPILVVQQRNQLVDQSAALMAEFGHRHSIQSRKSYSKARPNNVAPPNSASPFHYAAGCCRSPPSRDTSNVKSTFQERLFAIRFRKRGKQRERIEEIEFGLLERPLRRIIGFVKKRSSGYSSFSLSFYFLRRWKRFSPRFPSPVDPFATRNNAHYIGLVNFVEQGGRGGCKIVP